MATRAPDLRGCPGVMFTHNVETDIFARQVAVAADPVRRAVWRNQERKMRAFEAAQLSRFERVVAVSERDAEIFRTRFGLPSEKVETIPPGVDLADYPSVVIWCAQFGVLISPADLGT